MFKRWSCCAVGWLLCASIASISAGAHDLPLDRIMNGFVKVAPHQADFVVRVPLDLLVGVPFPVSGDHYNIAESGPAVEVALSTLAANLQLWENNTRLAPSSAKGKLVALSDRSFEEYDRALAHTDQAQDPDVMIGYQMGYLDAHFVYPISSPNSMLSIKSTLAADLGDYTKMAIRFEPLGEASRPIMINGASGRVALDPPWYAASIGFVRLGIEHILSGTDHLLFLLCLIIPFRRIRSLIPVITAFTVGHSITLIGTAYDLAPPGNWFPPFIEAAIAVSIFYMALENIVGAGLRRRWIIAGLFGLVHGFGFADILSEQLQFAGSNLLVALFSFNIGIEIGQLIVLCAFVPALALLLRGPMSGRTGVIILSAIVANVAWQWMLDRGQVLWDTPWPLPTPSGLMLLARWIVALVLAVSAAKLLTKWLDRKLPSQAVPEEIAANS